MQLRNFSLYSVYRFTAAIATMALVGLVTPEASADNVLNVNFGRTHDGSQFGGSGAYTGQGAYSDPGNNTWNNLLWTGESTPPSPSLTNNLVYSNNAAATGVSASFSGSIISQNYYSGSGAQSQLLYGMLLNQSTTLEDAVNIHGLTPNGTYNLYVYAQKSNTSGTTFSVEGTDYALSGGTAAQAGSLLNNVNYHQFTNVTADGSGLLSIGFKATTSADPDLFFEQGPFDGLQLVETTAAATPEPGTYALLTGLFVSGTVFLRRRRRKESGNTR